MNNYTTFRLMVTLFCTRYFFCAISNANWFLIHVVLNNALFGLFFTLPNLGCVNSYGFFSLSVSSAINVMRVRSSKVECKEDKEVRNVRIIMLVKSEGLQ